MLVEVADFYLDYEGESKAERKEGRKALGIKRSRFSICDAMMNEVESMVMDTIWEPPNYRPGQDIICLAAYRKVLARGLSAAETFAEFKAAFREVTGEVCD